MSLTRPTSIDLPLTQPPVVTVKNTHQQQGHKLDRTLVDLHLPHKPSIITTNTIINTGAKQAFTPRSLPLANPHKRPSQISNTATMCRKTIYFNTYVDGRTEVTEQVDACRQGRMCSRPEIREYQRQFRIKKIANNASPDPSSVSDRLPTPYHPNLNVHVNFPPSPPRSKSPSPSRKHAKHDDVFVEYDARATKEKNRRSTRDRVIVVPQAPEPAMPRRPPTQPEYLVAEDRDRDRHHRERDRSQQSRRHSPEIPLGFVPVVEDLTTPRKSKSPVLEDLANTRRRSPSSSPIPARPRDRRASVVDPRAIHWVKDEEKSDRHPKRERRKTMIGLLDDESSTANTAPAISRHDAFMTPATLVGRKERGNVRWDDEYRRKVAEHNAKIDARPARPARPSNPELRSILKKEKKLPPEAEVYDELRRASNNSDIPGTPRQNREWRERERDEYQEDPTYWARLKGRFGDDPETRRRRSKVVYAGEETYRYL